MEPNPTPPPVLAPRTSPMAIWSLVLGILSLTCFSIFSAIPAVICGHIANGKIKRSSGLLTGSGLALSGLITGYISIALAVFVLPVLVAIAVPNFVKARNVSMQNACINNLRLLDGAKQEWALENKEPGDATVTLEAIKTYLKRPVACPSGGTYRLGKVSEKPTCSIPGHTLPGNE